MILVHRDEHQAELPARLEFLEAASLYDRRQAEGAATSFARVEHLGRHVQALDVEARLQEREQKPTRAAHGLEQGPDRACCELTVEFECVRRRLRLVDVVKLR